MPSDSPAPSTRHAVTAVDKQRAQLEKLLKEPAKPAYIPPPPKEKTLRPAREMMKNVQGSSAGAGSGEFHVYKASRRREYERLKMLDDASKKELEEAEFAAKREEREAAAESKTAKNRAKRQKKKERSKAKVSEKGEAFNTPGDSDAPIKKRRLVNGEELVFKKPGEESESEDDGDGVVGPKPTLNAPPPSTVTEEVAGQAVDEHRIIIHEDD